MTAQDEEPVMTPIPAHLPPQPSATRVLTPAQYLEQVYVPYLERRVEELTKQLELSERRVKILNIGTLGP